MKKNHKLVKLNYFGSYCEMLFTRLLFQKVDCILLFRSIGVEIFPNLTLVDEKTNHHLKMMQPNLEKRIR